MKGKRQRSPSVGITPPFEYIYKAYCKRVYSVCLRMIRNPAEAEDLTQQTFLHLFRKIGTFRSESNFSTWPYRVTVNVVLLHMRHRKPAAALIEELEHYTANEEGKRKQPLTSARRRLPAGRPTSRRTFRTSPTTFSFNWPILGEWLSYLAFDNCQCHGAVVWITLSACRLSLPDFDISSRDRLARRNAARHLLADCAAAKLWNQCLCRTLQMHNLNDE